MHMLSIDSRYIRDSKPSKLIFSYVIKESKERISCAFEVLLHEQSMEDYQLTYIIQKISELS